MKPTIRRSAFLAFLIFAVSFSSQAQSDPSVAHLSGTLLDSSGAGVPGVRIKDPSCVSKTYPHFFVDLAALV